MATSVAIAVWAPVSAAGSPRLKAAPPTPSLSNPRALVSSVIQSHSNHRDTGTDYELMSSTLSVATTTGAKRYESVSASKSGKGSGIGLELTRHNNSSSQQASNDWEFGNLPKEDFSVRGGNATLKLAATSTGPFKGFTLTFTHTTATKETCNVSGSAYMYTGTLKGTQAFETKNTLERSSKLGSVEGQYSFPNTSKTNTTNLTVDNACTNKVPPLRKTKTYCETGTFWRSPFVHNGNYSKFRSLGGARGKIHSPTSFSFANVSGNRSVSITGLPATGGYGAHPATLNRNDSFSDALPTQAYRQSSTSPFALKETVTTPSTDTFMRGSAVLTSSSSRKIKLGRCYVGKTAYNQYERVGGSPGAFSWTNGSTKLAGKSAVGGKISISSRTGNTSAVITHDTYR